MTDPDPLPPLPDAFFDRIVDGDLSPAELRAALDRLDQQPDAWKRSCWPSSRRSAGGNRSGPTIRRSRCPLTRTGDGSASDGWRSQPGSRRLRSPWAGGLDPSARACPVRRHRRPSRTRMIRRPGISKRRSLSRRRSPAGVRNDPPRRKQLRRPRSSDQCMSFPWRAGPPCRLWPGRRSTDGGSTINRRRSPSTNLRSSSSAATGSTAAVVSSPPHWETAPRDGADRPDPASLHESRSALTPSRFPAQ